MKKALVLLVAGLCVASANAAQLDLLFADGSKEITLAPGEKAVVDVHFTSALPNESLANLAMTLDSAEAPHLAFSARGGAADTWVNASHAGTGLGFFDLSGGVLNGPFNDVVLGSIEIEMVGGAPEFPEHQCLIQADLNYPVNMLNASGTAFSRLAMGQAYLGYAGYYAIGSGSPGYSDTFGNASAADPLIVNCVPEPASLALLALGGLALIRRR